MPKNYVSKPVETAQDQVASDLLNYSKHLQA